MSLLFVKRFNTKLIFDFYLIGYTYRENTFHQWSFSQGNMFRQPGSQILKLVIRTIHGFMPIPVVGWTVRHSSNGLSRRQESSMRYT